MALVSAGFQLSVQLADQGGQVISKTYDLRSADFLAATADAAIILPLLDAVTTSLIQGYRISEVFNESIYALPIDAQNQDKASLSVVLAGLGGKKANLKIPAPIDGMFVAPAGAGALNNIVDVLDADVLAYCGIFGNGAQAYLSDGEDFQELVSGKRIHAKSNLG